ncbi:HD-GYP domain-containing protein [Alicyclobacillus suci]|uniref:HD-GYP domain-containing protein n=1 Tax=Alicyclobacillus suci TaxID=2816080 RepID=UPI001F18EFE0|nr:HD-GYP domain-containing protein [Alicyclobacillus suci]
MAFLFRSLDKQVYLLMELKKEYATSWLHHISQENGIERVESGNTTLTLLASKNGTEIIHHRLSKGKSWALTPLEGWDELEFIHLLSGRLHYKLGDMEGILAPGESLSAEPVQDYVIFTADEDSNFIYVCSNYVFHQYSEITRKFNTLAVEIAEKDGYTASHCERIKTHSLEIGRQMSLDTTELISLSFGAFFHDIGKLNIPDEILLKPSRLNDEEFSIIRMHTLFGKDILASTGLPHLIRAGVIAEQHHERFDGSGYPYGLSGNEIDIGASIVAVVDSYDAMTSNRPYQRAKSKDQAISEIRDLRGTAYHPDVVDTFLSLVDTFQDIE